jgi:hypothetical protein
MIYALSASVDKKVIDGIDTARGQMLPEKMLCRPALRDCGHSQGVWDADKEGLSRVLSVLQTAGSKARPGRIDTSHGVSTQSAVLLPAI